MTVTDVDERPMFVGGGTGANLFIHEGTTVVATLTAVDQDGDPVTYAISGGADAHLFTIDSATGALSLIEAADYEAPLDEGENNLLHVYVTASDGAFSTLQPVYITVSNVNEGLSITSGTAWSVAENVTAVGTVNATDADGDTPTYAIVGGADSALFAIDAATGALSFVAAPDFESPADADGDNVYELIVAASDGEFTDSRSMTVTVTNGNDHAPAISSPASFTAEENGLSVGSIAATDSDGDAVGYAISGGADADLFVIDAESGELRFVSAPDFEAAGDFDSDNVYEVIVSAGDGTLSSSQAIAVTIGNVDEGVAIVSKGGASSASVSVAENGLAIATVSAVDTDGGAVTYSIAGGADALLFEIDAATGLLSFRSAPDFEGPGDSGGDNVYDVIVSASDGNFSDSQALAVTVSNLNEAVTIISGGGGSAASLAVAENGLAVATVAAVDADGGPVAYSIAGGVDALQFEIDAATGLLSFVSAPDFEAPGDSGGDNVYDVIVAASDGSFSDSQAIALTVGNVNEGVTITSGGGASAASYSVSENEMAVTIVSAVDADGTNVSYAIAGGMDAQLFAIDAATGALQFLSAPDFELPGDADGDNVYQLVVTASDGSLGDSQFLFVTVGNRNEGVSIVSNGGGAVASVWVDENSQAVGSVLALDQDGGAIVYAIAGGADAARFAIDAQTGALRFLSAPNHEAPTDSGGNNVYDVIVSASDGTFSDSQALAVNVANVREGNVIVGTSANNTISTSSSVSGQPRATELEDTIYGLGGADNISGAGGADIIDGGAGNDILTGGLGGDILTGGTGADRFTYTQAAETAPGARDLIMDFSRAEGDKIALSSIDANSKSGGNQSFAFIGTNAFSGAAGQLRYELVDGHTIVSGDVNGDRVADFQIELNAPLALVATDFIL